MIEQQWEKSKKLYEIKKTGTNIKIEKRILKSVSLEKTMSENFEGEVGIDFCTGSNFKTTFHVRF